MPLGPRWPCPTVLPLPPLALQLQCRRGHGLTQRGLQPAAGLTSPHPPPVPGPRPRSHSRDRIPLQSGARGPLKPDAALKSVCGVWDGRLAMSDPDSKADHEPVATVGPQPQVAGGRSSLEPSGSGPAPECSSPHRPLGLSPQPRLHPAQALWPPQLWAFKAALRTAENPTSSESHYSGRA